jgi:hypothetical protein
LPAKARVARKFDAPRTEVDYGFYVENKVAFETAAEAEAFAALVTEALDYEMIVTKQAHHYRNVRPCSQTRLGILVLKFMNELPGRRTRDVEDLKAFFEEQHYSPNSVVDTVSSLAKEGLIRRIGTGTLERIDNVSPTTAVCSDVDVDTTVDGLPPRLDGSQAYSDRCGDKGHTHQDPGHRR